MFLRICLIGVHVYPLYVYSYSPIHLGVPLLYVYTFLLKLIYSLSDS